MTNDFVFYISDILTTHIAGSGGSITDFVIQQGEDELVYVDVEASKFFLITIREAGPIVSG